MKDRDLKYSILNQTKSHSSGKYFVMKKKHESGSEAMLELNAGIGISEVLATLKEEL